MLKARHELMIQAFGGTGHQATTPTEVATLLRDALAAGAPALIDCVIDPSDGPRAVTSHTSIPRGSQAHDKATILTTTTRRWSKELLS